MLDVLEEGFTFNPLLDVLKLIEQLFVHAYRAALCLHNRFSIWIDLLTNFRKQIIDLLAVSG